MLLNWRSLKGKLIHLSLLISTNLLLKNHKRLQILLFIEKSEKNLKTHPDSHIPSLRQPIPQHLQHTYIPSYSICHVVKESARPSRLASLFTKRLCHIRFHNTLSHLVKWFLYTSTSLPEIQERSISYVCQRLIEASSPI